MVILGRSYRFPGGISEDQVASVMCALRVELHHLGDNFLLMAAKALLLYFGADFVWVRCASEGFDKFAQLCGSMRKLSATALIPDDHMKLFYNAFSSTVPMILYAVSNALPAEKATFIFRGMCFESASDRDRVALDTSVLHTSGAVSFSVSASTALGFAKGSSSSVHQIRLETLGYSKPRSFGLLAICVDAAVTPIGKFNVLNAKEGEVWLKETTFSFFDYGATEAKSLSILASLENFKSKTAISKGIRESGLRVCLARANVAPQVRANLP